MTHRYISLFIKNLLKLTLGISVPITVLLWVVALCFDVEKDDYLMACFPLLLAAFFIVVNLLRIPIGIHIQKIQEKYLRTVFDDENVERIKGNMVFLCDRWVIFAGRLALHKDFIQTVSIRREMPKRRFQRAQGGYYCIFKCINSKKYFMFVPCKADAYKISKWIKQVKAS